MIRRIPLSPSFRRLERLAGVVRSSVQQQQSTVNTYYDYCLKKATTSTIRHRYEWVRDHSTVLPETTLRLIANSTTKTATTTTTRTSTSTFHHHHHHPTRTLSYKRSINCLGKFPSDSYITTTIFEGTNSSIGWRRNYHYRYLSTSSLSSVVLSPWDVIDVDDVNSFESNNNNLLTVCILGPPNAGKSTLFNRLLCKESNKTYRLSVDKGNRSRNDKGRTANKLVPSWAMNPSRAGGGGGAAIVSPLAGTTRDRRECIGRIGTVKFRLYDTAGIDVADTGSSVRKNPSKLLLEKKLMMEQTIEAATVSDLILLLYDGRNSLGVTPDLLETTRWLRKVVVVKNKRSGSDNNNNNNNNNKTSDSNNSILLPVPPTKRIVVCANKLEGTGIMPDQWMETMTEVSLKLGFGDVLPLSALHGDVGIAEIGTIVAEIQNAKMNYYSHLLQQHQQQQQLENEELNNESSYDVDEKIENNDLDSDYLQHTRMETTTKQQQKQQQQQQPKNEKPLQLAILGRPNVGKSTLVNQLLQEQRVLTGPTPGLTRDAIVIPFLWNGRPVQIVDTAGIRKPKSRRSDTKTRTNEFVLSLDDENNINDNNNENPSKRNSSKMNNNNNNNIPVAATTDYTEIEQLAYIEEMAVADAVRALKVADVAVLVLDAQAGNLHKHELAICNAILQEGRALTIVANKMDLLLRNGNRDNDDDKYTRFDFERDVRKELEERFPILRKTPIIPMSSLHGDGVNDLLPAVFKARDRWERKIPTGQLNRWLADAVLSRHAPPPSSQNKTVRIKYIIQTKGRPPTFLLFCSGAGSYSSSSSSSVPTLPDSYIRYLTRNFQDAFNMYGMEIRFAIKNSTGTKGNPYTAKAKSIGGSISSGSVGVGGREGRQKRFVQALKTTGVPPPSRRRKRSAKFTRR